MAASSAPVIETGTCFIITPFKGFDDLTKLVKLAAGNQLVRQQAFRNDEVALGLPFSDTIADEIQAATMVVAVCSPEADGKPNGNVVYELGLANAFHKPALILTTDPETLPSDFRHITSLKYTRDDLRDEEGFVKTLALEMAKIRQRSGYRRLPPAPKGPQTRIVVTAEFWTCFHSVVTATNQARKALKALESPVTELLELALGLLKGDQAILFVTSWTRLRGLDSKKDTIEKLTACRREWRQNYSRLSANPEGRIMEHLVAVESQITDLPKQCDAAESAHAALVPKLEDAQSKTTAYLALMHVRDSIVRLDEELHNLLFSMLEEIP